jgi:hypothetical protein
MSDAPYNKPVFPTGSYFGMSLRDYFAAHALAGSLAQPEAFQNPSHAAEWAYQHADAMLRERETQRSAS